MEIGVYVDEEEKQMGKKEKTIYKVQVKSKYLVQSLCTGESHWAWIVWSCI